MIEFLTGKDKRLLLVLLGPTGVGKTDLSIELASRFGTVIISCDSRQVYKEMCIGTAVPEQQQLAEVPHFFIRTVSVKDYYSCWEFEQEVLKKLEDLFTRKNLVVMTGGSMMYIDAVCRGMDDIPDVDPEIRKQVMTHYQQEGLESIRMWLRKLDPVFYGMVDLKNPKRIMHAVEISLTAGKPYSSLRTGTKKARPFEILKIGLDRDKDELYERINSRVDLMISAGLEQEARELYPCRAFNSLNTVGYKEFFDYFDGKTDLQETIRLIKRNSRHYAKKQLSWFRRDKEIHWFHPGEKDKILELVEQRLIT